MEKQKNLDIKNGQIEKSVEAHLWKKKYAMGPKAFKMLKAFSSKEKKGGIGRTSSQQKKNSL